MQTLHFALNASMAGLNIYLEAQYNVTEAAVDMPVGLCL